MPAMDARRRLVLGVAAVVACLGAAAGGALLVSGRAERAPDGAGRAEPVVVAAPMLAGRPPAEESRPHAEAPPPRTAQSGPGPALRGTVVDSAGRPVGGVEVSLWSHPTLRTTSGDDGRFVLEVPPEAPADEWWFLRLVTSDRRLVASEPRFLVTVGERATLVMAEACEVRVTARDAASGRPVPEAVVCVVAGEQVATDLDWARRARWCDEARTDAAGRAVLRAPAGMVQVQASARGHNRAVTKTAHLSSEGLDLVVDLSAGGTVVGRVLDPGGAGVAGAEVHAVGDPIYEARARTDAAGAFRLEDTPAGEGELTLSVLARGWAPAAWSAPLPDPGKTAETSVTLREARVLVGRAVTSDGSPAAGVRVDATPDSLEWFRVEQFGDEPAQATSGPDGTFRLTPVAPGIVDVDGYTQSGRHFGSAKHPVPESGPVPELVLRQEKGGSRGLVVRVVDADGKPLAGVYVDALTQGDDADDFDRVGGEDTDAAGTARFATGLPAGRVLFVADANGRLAPTRKEVDLTDPAATETEIRIPRGAVRGQVRTKDGAPARVELVCRRLKPDGTPDAWMTSVVFLQTDAEGRFAVAGLGEDAYTLEAWNAGDLIVVGPGSFRAGTEELRWTLVDRAETIARVELFDAVKRVPLENAWVTVVGTPGGFERDETTPGRYLSPPIPAGRYDLSVKVPGFRTAVVRGVELAPGAAAPRLELTFEPGCVLEGRVVLRTTKEPVEAGVSAGGEQTFTEGGSFRLEGLDPGPVEVVVAGGGVLPASCSVLVSTNEPTRMDLEVDPAGWIVLVAAKPHADWELLEVSCRAMDGSHSEDYFLDVRWAENPENHLTEFGGLRTGRYRVEVTVGGKRFEREVDVVAGRESRVVVDLE
jgi:protocatechuate 3,4-dioxygenase beta subunit